MLTNSRRQATSRLLKNGDRPQFRSCKFMIAGNELTRNWVAGPFFSTLVSRVMSSRHNSRSVGRPILAASRPSGRLDPLESGSAG
jgi:hypothetical protein